MTKWSLNRVRHIGPLPPSWGEHIEFILFMFILVHFGATACALLLLMMVSSVPLTFSFNRAGMEAELDALSYNSSSAQLQD